MFCQVRAQFCGAACSHTALDFGFTTGKSWGYCSGCNFSKQVDALVTSKFAFKDTILHVTDLIYAFSCHTCWMETAGLLATGGSVSPNIFASVNKATLALFDCIVDENCCPHDI